MHGHNSKPMDIAHHEAGHAVGGYLLGRRFSSLDIWGRIQFEEVLLEDQDAITTEVIVTLAGPLAQGRNLRETGSLMAAVIGTLRFGWHSFGEDGGDSDMDIVRLLLTWLCGDDGEEAKRELERLSARTEELFDQTPGAWAAVETLATALYAREILSYEEATEIIQAALKQADI